MKKLLLDVNLNPVRFDCALDTQREGFDVGVDLGWVCTREKMEYMEKTF
jgi:hypothetical protein